MSKPLIVVTGTPGLRKSNVVETIMQSLDKVYLLDDGLTDAINEREYKNNASEWVNTSYGSATVSLRRFINYIEAILDENLKEYVLVANRFISCGMLFAMMKQKLTFFSVVDQLHQAVTTTYDILAIVAKRRPVLFHIAVLGPQYRLCPKNILRRIKDNDVFDKETHNEDSILTIDAIYCEFADKLMNKLTADAISGVEIHLHYVSEDEPLSIPFAGSIAATANDPK